MAKRRDELDSQGRRTGRETGQDEDLVAAEKYNPALRGNVKSQDEVESSGGLGALAKKLKGIPSTSSTPTPAPETEEEKRKKKVPKGLGIETSSFSRNEH